MNIKTKPEPLKPTALPEKPGEKIGMILCGPFPGGEGLLVTVGYYSKWFQVGVLHFSVTSKVLDFLDNWFTVHSMSKVIMSDNGVKFRSEEIKSFLQCHGIKRHMKVTPYSPQENDAVERQDKSLLKVIRPLHSEGKSWWKKLNTFLIAYKSIPHSVTVLAHFK